MKLQALRLEKFKKHEDLTIEFSDTLTVIRGPNWAGKSSILHGIFFALFGASAVPCSKERIPTRGQKNTKVSLWFSWNGVDCVIERTLTTCTLYVDGAVKATSASAVTNFVQEEILGLSLKDALTLAYSPQSQTAALLTLGVPALNRMIESLSQADFIETLITRAASVANKAESGLAAIGESLDEIEPREQVVAWTETLEIAERTFTEVAALGGSIQTELRLVEREYTEKTDRNEKLLFAKSDRDQLNRIMTAHSETATKIQALGSIDIQKAQDTLTSAQKTYGDLYQQTVEKKSMVSDLIKLDQWFDTTGADWQAKEANIPLLADAKAVLEQKTETLNSARTALAVSQDKLKTLRQAVETSICAACNRPFDNHDHSAAEKAWDEESKRAEEAAEKHALATAEFTAARSEVWRLEKLQPPAGYEDAYAAKIAEYESLQKNLAAIPDDPDALAAAQRAVEQAQAAVASARSQQQTLRELQLQQQTYEIQIQTLNKALAGYPTGEPESLTGLVAKLDELRRKSHEHISQHSQAQQKVSDAKSSRTAWQAQLDAAVARNTKRLDLEKRAERFTAVVKWLRASKSAFLGKIWDNLTLIASELISNATLGYASTLHRTDDGEFVVIEDGEEVPMVSASGGMNAICGVALRLALDSVLAQSVGFVVLDEPSSELSDEHAASLAGALRASQRQVILVTHREGEEFVSDSVITL